MAIKTRLRESSRHSENPLAPTTVSQCRRGPFLPLSQVPKGFKGRDFAFDNQWGKCTVRKCALTQTHQNIIDLIRTNAILTKTAPDGQVLVVFSPYVVLRALEDKGTNHSWLNKKIEELETVRIDTEVKGWKITSGIVRKHARSLIDNEAAQNRGGIAKDAKYWYVIFESEYSRFFLNDIGLHYEALLSEIIRLKHGVTQAVVRFCLSHDLVNMALDDALLGLNAFDCVKPEDEPKPGQVTLVTPIRTQRQIRKNIRDEAESLKRDFGIEIRKMGDGREGVFYKKHPKVWFDSPEKPVLPSSPVIDAPENEAGQGAAMV